MNPTAGLAADSRTLDRLKAIANDDPKAALRQAAGQFEALFMQQLLKSMRAAMPHSGLMEGPNQQMYVEMLDQQLAQSMGGRAGGLADVIARQLSRNIKGGEPPAVAAPAARVAPPTVSAAVAGTGSAAADAPAPSPAQAAFVSRLWPHALAAQHATGVPAAFVMGQAALESGWGKGEIRDASGNGTHNLFGIKAGSSWRGPTVDVTTTEYVNGVARKVVEKFRAYGSYAEAFKDWVATVGSQPRYAAALRAGGDAQRYANGLQRAGYATDPAYGEKLEKTINQTLRLRRLII